MDLAKIQLSKEELVLVQNADVLLTKNRIIKKVYELFGSIIPDMQQLLERNLRLPSAVFIASPKISKGENYLGLPYVMLDYPRCFGKEDIFAIRTMFWWGNFFSITLHLRGVYKNQFMPAVLQNLSFFGKNHFFLSIGDDEWRHDFLDDNYTPIKNINEADMRNLVPKAFCKLAAQTGFDKWNEIPAKLLQSFEVILQGIDFNSQGGGTGL